MDVKHSVEYQLTSELATEIQQTLFRFGLRHGWRTDLPLIAGGIAFALVLAYPVFAGWLAPGVAAGMLFFVTLLIIGKLYGRRSGAFHQAVMAVVGLHSTDRRVRIEFDDERVRMDTEHLRGEAAWSEIEEIAVFPTFWAVRFTNRLNIVIPAAQMTSDLQTFLRGKAELAEAPVEMG